MTASLQLSSACACACSGPWRKRGSDGRKCQIFHSPAVRARDCESMARSRSLVRWMASSRTVGRVRHCVRRTFTLILNNISGKVRFRSIKCSARKGADRTCKRRLKDTRNYHLAALSICRARTHSHQEGDPHLFLKDCAFAEKAATAWQPVRGARGKNPRELSFASWDSRVTHKLLRCHF
jgi:hypothetical protein